MSCVNRMDRTPRSFAGHSLTGSSHRADHPTRTGVSKRENLNDPHTLPLRNEHLHTVSENGRQHPISFLSLTAPGREQEEKID